MKTIIQDGIKRKVINMNMSNITVENVKETTVMVAKEIPELKDCRIGVVCSHKEGNDILDGEVDILIDAEIVKESTISKLRNMFPCKVSIFEIPLLKRCSDSVKERIGMEDLVYYESMYDRLMKKVMWVA